MRVSKCALAFLATALIALPITAAVKAMTLKELMAVTTDAVHGKIVSRDVIRLSHPWEGAIYTQLTIEGESIRTGEQGTFTAVFHGSHRTEDWYGISSMPTLQDSRQGGEGLFFFGEHPMAPGHNMVFNHAGLYRVERGFGEPVIVGKGEGAAFAENTKLESVKTSIRATHADLARARSAPGLSK